MESTPGSGVLCNNKTRHLPTRALHDNYAAVLHEKNDLRYEKSPELGDLQAGRVRIHIKAVGICGSDVHMLKAAALGFWEVTGPLILGHESAGVVADVGPGVKNLQVGDRVALEPGFLTCWASVAARNGRYNVSEDLDCFGCPMTHGALRHVMDHHADFCFKLPDNVSFEEGAMCEPLSVGIHACRRGMVQPGKNVLILGAGPIGLMTLLSAQAFGATKITVTDISSHNLSLAETMGATHTYCHPKTAAPKDIADHLKQVLSPNLPGVILDCVGMESTVQTAVFASCPGSKIVIVGLGQENVSVPLSMLTLRELDILGSLRYTNTYPMCLSLLEDKKIDVLPMISHRLGFSEEDLAKGFDIALRAAETKAVKVMFKL